MQNSRRHSLAESLRRTPLTARLTEARPLNLQRAGVAALRSGASQFRSGGRQKRGLQVGGGYSENPYLARIARGHHFDFGRDGEAPEDETPEQKKKRLKSLRMKQKISDLLNKGIEFQKRVRSARPPDPHFYG